MLGNDPENLSSEIPAGCVFLRAAILAALTRNRKGKVEIQRKKSESRQSNNEGDSCIDCARQPRQPAGAKLSEPVDGQSSHENEGRDEHDQQRGWAKGFDHKSPPLWQ